jgi:hypothetical protein
MAKTWTKKQIAALRRTVSLAGPHDHRVADPTMDPVAQALTAFDGVSGDMTLDEDVIVAHVRPYLREQFRHALAGEKIYTPPL